MNHRSLYVGFAFASAVCLLLAVLAFRSSPGFPTDDPLVKKLPPNIDEWAAPNH